MSTAIRQATGKQSIVVCLLSILGACTSAPSRHEGPDPTQRAAHDMLFRGCMEQRLFEQLDEYIAGQLALTQIGPLRYEGFVCECTANAAAQRPYVAAMLARTNRGEELNDTGARILKAETIAALMQCTSAWLDKSATAIADGLLKP